MFEAIIDFLVKFTETLGYFGIFLMTALESTFLPIPSEATMIPAGYLVHQGKMDGPIVFVLSVLGTLTGSLVNYWIAYHYGRGLFIRYGKYILMDEEKLLKMEDFFQRHGPISIFVGRLILGVRHYLSFPAGLARMGLKKFCIYTATGGAIWMFTLLTLGYLIGDNQELLKKILPWIKLGLVLVVALIIFVYVKRSSAKRRSEIKSSSACQAPPRD